MKTSALLFLLLTTPLLGQEGIRFPSQPPPPAPSPNAVAKLAPHMFYVIDSDVSVIVTASPLGIVQVTEESGPIKVRGLFVDGTGKTETRTFTGKHIFFIEAAGTGVCEVLVIPVGAKKATEILRRTLSVQGDAPDEPTPPKTALAYLTFVGTTLATAAITNDAGIRARLKTNDVSVYVETVAAFSARSAESAKIIADIGAPCIILQDAAGNVLGNHRMTTVEAANEFLNSYIGK